jgi:exodeoxyribonuclease VII large subunit
LKTYSLQELNEFLRRVIALNFNESVWITAEIGQIGLSRGHYYIDLLQKEESAIIAEMSAVIWATDYKRIQRILGSNTVMQSLMAQDALKGVLAEGMEIKLKGRLDFHEKFGLKIIIEDIDATYTIGKLELQRRQLINDLNRKGLLARNKNLRLPTVIQRIAVISSETAAGWQDFKNQISHNDYQYAFDIQFFQSAMQGSLVEKTMMHQLDSIKILSHLFDCVVIIRGGGSRLDLSAFDTPTICETIAKFPIPVITGIGHETDQSVIDLVAHSSLKTPTAVADFIVAHNLRFEASLIEIQNFINHYVSDRLNTEGGKLQLAENSIQSVALYFIKNQQNMLDYIEKHVPQYAESAVKYENLKITSFTNIIDLISIEATLKRGFSLTKVNNEYISQLDEIKEGDILETQILDGVLKSRVIN